MNNWVSAATTALRNNKSSFAVMSMDDISRPDGKLAALRAKGFTVDEP
jgi:hypothetical protein